MTPRALREWGSILWTSLQPDTIKLATCAARAFFRWMAQEELVESNPAARLRPPSVRAHPQRTLSANKISLLLVACPETPKGIRDTAIVALLLDAGLRASELCALTIDALSLESSRILVQGKGSRLEWAHFATLCRERLAAWLEIRPLHCPADTRHVFVSLQCVTSGAPFTPRGLRMILKKLGDRAVVPHVHPHTFRRSFATLAIKAGAPTRLVQRLGRWRDIKLVERYTAVLETEDAGWLQKAYSPLSYVGV